MLSSKSYFNGIHLNGRHTLPTGVNEFRFILSTFVVVVIVVVLDEICNRGPTCAIDYIKIS